MPPRAEQLRPLYRAMAEALHAGLHPSSVASVAFFGGFRAELEADLKTVDQRARS
jgi:hypothetical protein